MDNFEVNKIVGAVLGTALFVLCLSFLSDMIYATPKLEKQAYVVETLVAEAQGNSDADNIIVLKQGKVKESGSHSKLLQQNGWYAKVWKMQELENLESI